MKCFHLTPWMTGKSHVFRANADTQQVLHPGWLGAGLSGTEAAHGQSELFHGEFLEGSPQETDGLRV